MAGLALAACALGTAVAVNETSTPGENPAKAVSATQALGFKADVFAAAGQVKNPTAICFDALGRAYVSETYRWRRGVEDNRDHTYWIMDDLATMTVEDRAKLYEKHKDRFGEGYFTTETERVVRLTDTDGDGKADEVKEFATDFKEAVDGPAIGLIARGSTTVYLACIPHVWLLEDADGDGQAEKKVPLVSGLGVRNSLSGHDLHGFAWGPDGKLYFSMGDRGYHVTSKEGKTFSDPGSGAVFRCDPDGSNLELFHTGLRNPQELAFNELGDLFTVDNNCDQGDKARVCYLLEGGDTGWHMGHQALTTYKDYLKDGGFAQKPHWLAEHLWEKPQPGQPRWIIPPIDHLTDGPSGLVYTDGLALPDAYAGSFLVCDYKGSANQCRLWSFKTEPIGPGYAMKDAHVFQNGVACVDVDEGPDGKIYVVDFGGGWVRTDAGNVFALSWPEGQKRPAVSETKALLTTDFAARGTDELLALLSHADWRVRQRAQFALAAKGPENTPALSKLADDGNLNALWALRQLKSPAPLRALVTHATPEVRAQALRALGDLRYADARPAFRAAIASDSARERIFAALALSKNGSPEALGDVVAMVAKRGVDDAFQRHAGMMALAGCADAKTLASFSTDASPAVRLSALLALRHLRSAEISAFLRDADATIAAEAVRAINDLPIAAAQPVLAAEARRFIGQVPPALFGDEYLFRRLLRANQVTGTPEAAETLAHLAVNPALSENFRQLALLTLRTFHAPEPIDPTTGLHRPLPPRDKKAVKSAIAGPLAPLLTSASGHLTASALRVAAEYDLPVGATTLAAWASDEKQPLDLRLAAVDRLGPEVRPLLDTSTPEVRAAAARRWVKQQPDDIETALRILIAHNTVPDLRAAYEIAAGSKHAAAATTLAAELDRFAAGKVPADVQLDLYEAAVTRTEEPVKAKFTALEASLAAAGRTPFDLTVAGGDPVRGRDVFDNQGTCLKCHRIGPVGGSAGPKLDGLATRLKPAEMLQSLVNPNAVIVEGYGIAALTLQDGTAVAGTPVGEDADTVSMRTPAGDVQVVAKKDIKERTPPVSPMPPLGLVLPRRDVRDVMAFLQSLK